MSKVPGKDCARDAQNLDRGPERHPHASRARTAQLDAHSTDGHVCQTAAAICKLQREPRSDAILRYQAIDATIDDTVRIDCRPATRRERRRFYGARRGTA